MKELLSTLQSILNTVNPPMTGLLNLPIKNPKEIETRLAATYSADLSIPGDLLLLYEWHNGTKMMEGDGPSIKAGYFAEELFFCSFEDAISQIHTEEFYEFRKDKQFPLFTSFNGEFLALDLNDTNRLIYCSTWDIEIDSKISMYDSLESLVKTTIKFYEANLFYKNEDGIVELDLDKYDEYMAIGEEMNPGSDYWRVKREWAEENE